MSKHTHHRAIHPALLILFFTFAWFAESAGDYLVLSRLVDFIRGKKESDYSISNWQLWLGFGLTALSSLPYIITMLFYWSDSRRNTHHQHSHSHLHTMGELAIEGGPFGALSTVAGYKLLKKINSSNQLSAEIINWVVSSAGGVAIIWGNFKLHSSHLHAKDSAITLFKRLTFRLKLTSILLGISILAGHLSQGALAGTEFIDGVHKNSPLYGTLSAAILLGGLVAFFEGHSEVRAALAQLNNDNQTKKIVWPVKFALSIPAALHATQPVQGSIEIVSMIYKLCTGNALVQALSLESRIGMVALSGICLGLGNYYGFWNMNLLTFNRAAKSCLKSMTECGAILFHKPKHTGELAAEQERLINAGSIVNDLQPVV